jgi:hypothetical protein
MSTKSLVRSGDASSAIARPHRTLTGAPAKATGLEHAAGSRSIGHRAPAEGRTTRLPYAQDAFTPGPTRASTGQGDRRGVFLAVPFFSQFEPGHGYDPGKTSCFLAAMAMVAEKGAKVTGPDQRIQLATAEDEKGRLTIDPAKAAQARSYIDQQLDEGWPVVVGVSHKDAHYNVDALTDHFVVITGRGVDEQGRTYYAFHDPSASRGDKGSDTNPKNRLCVDEATGRMYRPGKDAAGLVVDRRLEVAMVRRNE